MEFDGEDLVIDGIKAKQFVESLKLAGLSDDAVTQLLGQALAGAQPVVTGAAAAASTGPFHFATNVAQVAPECGADYTRTFFHPDFFDGLTVVQASQNAAELGFNARFHIIESNFDAISTNLNRISNCVAELRLELFGIAGELETKITEIEDRLSTKGKEKDTKDTKDKDKDKEKEGKEGKDKEKETKDTKDKEKDTKDAKEKDTKEHIDKVSAVEKVPLEKISLEKTFDHLSDVVPTGPEVPAAGDEPGNAPGDEPGTGQTFIRPEERPDVGERALREEDE